jgi:hypothetical protein
LRKVVWKNLKLKKGRDLAFMCTHLSALLALLFIETGLGMLLTSFAVNDRDRILYSPVGLCSEYARIRSFVEDDNHCLPSLLQFAQSFYVGGLVYQDLKHKAVECLKINNGPERMRDPLHDASDNSQRLAYVLCNDLLGGNPWNLQDMDEWNLFCKCAQVPDELLYV